MRKEKFVFEFWAIDCNKNKYHEYLKTKSSRLSKVKNQIESKFNFKINDCLDFGIRRHFE